MSFVKYRVKEVAADFGVTPKEIAEIVAKFSEKPKSNTQVLTDVELNAVFDYMTQHNQISSMEQVFAVKPAAPKAEEPKAAAPAQQGGRPQGQQGNRPQGQQQGNRPQGQQGNRPQGQQGNRPQGQQQGNRPQGQQGNRPQPQQQAQQPVKAAEPERKRERRVVDTSAVQVNANRFADVDNLVSERVQNYEGGKQRIGGGKGKQQKQQPGKNKGNKYRNEEQEKMRRLQMEIARQAPLTVKIPD
ncbi:MAG: hypothetical protein IKU68_07580, partial [Oscillospiraceae bacterium]|nr:hypothetical protein [Oscillospiraceae bacterium]